MGPLLLLAMFAGGFWCRRYLSRTTILFPNSLYVVLRKDLGLFIYLNKLETRIIPQKGFWLSLTENWNYWIVQLIKYERAKIQCQLILNPNKSIKSHWSPYGHVRYKCLSFKLQKGCLSVLKSNDVSLILFGN